MVFAPRPYDGRVDPLASSRFLPAVPVRSFVQPSLVAWRLSRHTRPGWVAFCAAFQVWAPPQFDRFGIGAPHGMWFAYFPNAGGCAGGLSRSP